MSRGIVPAFMLFCILANSAFAGEWIEDTDQSHDRLPLEYDSNWYLGGRVGYIKIEDVDDKGSFNIGAIGGVFFLPGLSMEASCDFQQSDFYLELTDDIVIWTEEIERETIAFQIGLTFTPLPDKAVRPFVLGGLGWYFSEYSSTSGAYDNDRISDGGYYVGAGLDILGGGWRDDLSIVGDVRWLFTQKEEFAEQDIKADGFMVSVGFRWKF